MTFLAKSSRCNVATNALACAVVELFRFRETFPSVVYAESNTKTYLDKTMRLAGLSRIQIQVKEMAKTEQTALLR